MGGERPTLRRDQVATREPVTRPGGVRQLAVPNDPQETKGGVAGSCVAGLPVTDGPDGDAEEIRRRLAIKTGVNTGIAELFRLDDLEAGPLAAARCQLVVLPIMSKYIPGDWTDGPRLVRWRLAWKLPGSGSLPTRSLNACSAASIPMPRNWPGLTSSGRNVGTTRASKGRGQSRGMRFNRLKECSPAP